MILVGNIFSGIINGVPLSLTTIGDSGAATLDTTTGVLNIPIYNTSGGTVETDNGIGGDGSIGTPVILGGDLSQFTTIGVNNFPFTISGTDGDGNTSFYFQSNDSIQAVTGLVTGESAGLFTSASPGTVDAQLAYVDAESNNQSIDVSNEGLGIVVKDEVDNIALIGVQDYSDPTKPFQYLQRGDQEILLRTQNNADDAHASVDIVSDDGSGNGGITISYDNSTGDTKEIILNNTIDGLLVVDSKTTTGLIGFNDFSNPLKPNQYMQRASMGDFVPFGSAFTADNQAGNITIVPAFIPSVTQDALFTLNAVLIINALAAGVTVILSYTDMNGNAQTPAIVTGAAIGNNSAVPLTFRALKNTNVSLTATSTTGTYSVDGVLSLINLI